MAGVLEEGLCTRPGWTGRSHMSSDSTVLWTDDIQESSNGASEKEHGAAELWEDAVARETERSGASAEGTQGACSSVLGTDTRQIKLLQRHGLWQSPKCTNWLPSAEKRQDYHKGASNLKQLFFIATESEHWVKSVSEKNQKYKLYTDLDKPRRRFFITRRKKKKHWSSTMFIGT